MSSLPTVKSIHDIDYGSHCTFCCLRWHTFRWSYFWTWFSVFHWPQCVNFLKVVLLYCPAFILRSAGRGGTHLWSQHLGGRGRWISEFEASLVYKVSFRTTRATEKPCLEKPKKQNKTKQNKKPKTKNQKNQNFTWFIKSAFNNYILYRLDYDTKCLKSVE